MKQIFIINIFANRTQKNNWEIVVETCKLKYTFQYHLVSSVCYAPTETVQSKHFERK